MTEAAASGVTVLIASHEPGPVEALAGRAVTVTGGRVTAQRTLAAHAAPAAPPAIPSALPPTPDLPPTAPSDGAPGGPGDGRFAPSGADRPTPTGPVAHVA